jgi:hypothetical protein
VFPYAEAPTSGQTHPTGRYVFRPVVNITLVGPESQTESEYATFLALVDSGAERVLAAPGVARQIRVTPDRTHAEPLKIGGEVRMVHPAEVTLRLSPELGLPGVEWRADVGFFSEWTSAPGKCCSARLASSISSPSPSAGMPSSWRSKTCSVRPSLRLNPGDPQGRRWNQAIEAAAPSRSRSAAPPMNSDVSSRFSST